MGRPIEFIFGDTLEIFASGGHFHIEFTEESLIDGHEKSPFP
jgi:hypothetical protein